MDETSASNRARANSSAKSTTYCFCGQSYDPEQFMIQCDVCKEWYHGGCVSIKEYSSTDLDKYHCPSCAKTNGPSLLKTRMNWHRHDYSESEATSKAVQTGTPVFIRELKSRHFSKADDIVKHVRGQQLTLQYLQNNGFEVPIIIDGKDGLDMTVPPPNFSVYDVESYIGGDREMDVIDVMKQSNVRMKLRDFVEYYNDPGRTRILNVISLEFTNTGLSPMVEAPYIARKIDWVNSVWPRDWPEDSELKRPEVQKYCLMGVKDSFTDFHIDFGGTSVWYHVLRGEKIFYLVKPSSANIQLYQQWMCSSNQSETFFGDQADACYKCIIKQGQTMMIPTGWIHAVLTPVDSLVFGGNFLHSFNIPMQIQIYELEKKLKTPSKYQYPGFETINWFAAKRLLKELKELNNEEKKCPPYLLQGVKALLSILKQWNTDKDYNMTSRGQIPHTINSLKLLKDFSKDIRNAERYLISLNPPKPERESKRKRKKPMNKDFVDYDMADQISVKPLKLNVKETSKAEPKIEAEDGARLPGNRPPLKLTLPKTTLYPHAKGKVRCEGRSIKENEKCVKKLGNKSLKVIKFKLGNKEVIRSTNEGINNFDEAPKRKKKHHHNAKNQRLANVEKKIKTDFEGDVDVLTDAPKNGIEELLKASAYALTNAAQRLEPPTPTSVSQYGQPTPPPTGICKLKTASSGRASPSTREAIAGMLSFSEQCYSTTSGSPEKSNKSEQEEDDDQLIENMDKVHQDEDFIYPALDASDDEEFIFKPRGKRRVDEAWNPKARVGPLLPKTNRPAREGVKKTSVEKGLEAAAAKRAKQHPVAKRTYNKRKQKEVLLPVIPVPVVVAPPVEEVETTTDSYGSILTSPNRLKDVKAKLAAPIPAERKPKKGMKTAKQRLGKILKLHKMMH